VFTEALPDNGLLTPLFALLPGADETGNTSRDIHNTVDA
jgi:hypothetical protein